MFLVGPIVNTIAIIMGTIIGVSLKEIPERMRTTVLQGMALFVITLGITMAIAAPSGDIIYIVLSVVLGGVLGAWWDLEGALERFGKFAETTFKGNMGGVSEAFVFASLVFGVGSMAVLGALQSGLDGQNTILYTKSILDGFSAVIFTTVMGPGVGLSAIPILIYEGGLALIAHFMGADLRSASIIADVTAVGGLLIMGIGVNILEIKRIRVANLLPAMGVVALVRWLATHATPLLASWIHF
ncbi:DUF554 domain-containing protein [Sulfoacidibacillus thermotolerans]|uniref:DUF554 domain-containing protein n=1 Tax=Sulfoacidibacillus thermotolerans TaxID=1765684 RepID=A0A2U3D6B0_SULT2|nr:DUF554 domain-containing protein [Sulfoacidibacillus thermotolerans]PWI56818.1 hypothetical protein BM613_11730 [Sulfoacidibacillus thermotolerans]